MNSSPKNILALCGSTRTVSANAYIIKALEKLVGTNWSMTIYDLTTLPYFNQDVGDEQVQPSVSHFRKAIAKADAVLICTPEYVFSLPGILKNALEWTVSTTVFSDKPTALITASSSGEKAHESLLLVMKTLGVKTSDELCLLISGVKSKLDSNGEVIDKALVKKLHDLVNALDQ
jgi:NAD(P)H-dependent FMN reductase